jgi:hypothetical protein
MQTILTVAIWCAVAGGYISMLVLTERGAARYVRGDVRGQERLRVRILNAGRPAETHEASPDRVPHRHRSITESAWRPAASR